ncbi:MAG: Ig-like domain-containing protein, partial [Pirellulales bacterium]
YYAAFNADDLTTTVTVDTTADYASGDLNYGDTSSIAALIADKGDDGLISLREAIDAANNQSGLDTIEFNIAVNDSGHFYYSDDGVANQVSTGFIANTTAANDGLIVDIDPDFAKSWYSIAPSAALPDITDAIIIDGTTQPGYTDSPIIELNGSGAGASANGLTIEGGNSTIRGLVINEFDVSGIRIDVLGGNTIAGNYIGTDVSGTLQVGSDVQDRGIYVLTSGNTIGGTTAADRNVISGNRLQGVLIQQSGTTNNQVTGNYIGTTADGSAQLANVGGGQQMGVYLWDTPANTIGGTADGAGNVISGNLWYGVYAWGPNASGNMIQGNTIGMDAAGSTAIGNGSSTQAGIYIASASGNTIGGVAADAGNLIAGNPGSGIIITGTTPTGNSILSNSIHTNGKLGVDLDSDGITFNDVDDVDLGANESLNFAVITDVTQNGADLDVTIAVDLPTTNTSWYRVEFFENPNGSDSTGHGEGEILLDAATIQVTGAAGYETFNVTLSGVTPTQILGMSVTVTEDTSAGAGTTFGSTSEFGPSYLGAGILEVTTTSDDSDGDTSTIATLLGDRGADGEISLREAMEAANSTSGAEIHFRIDTSDPNYDVGSGTWLIQPGSALPFMNNGMTIDARTQTGYAGTPLIDLDGTNAVGASGFVSDAGNIHIHGFAIRNFDGAGIELQDGTVNSFMGNYIGTDVTGTVAHANNIGVYVIGGAGNTTIGGSVAGSGNLISGNTQWGVWLTSDDNTIAGNLIGTNASGLGSLANLSGIFVDGSFNNTIGGTTALERNVISGNTFGVIVSGAGANNNNLYGNYIGADVNGTTNLGNTTGGVAFGNGADGNRVGGTLAGQGNVISGNGDAGILIDGSNDNLVQGNLIGTDAAGTGAIGNDVDGIRIVNAAADNLIGGAFADAANTIANNTGDGVRMDATAGLGNSVLSNLIYSNTGLGIDLEVDGVTDNDLNDVDAGANNVQNFPVITQADLNGTDLTVSGTLDTDWANTQYRIEFFGIAAGDQDATNGEGRYYLGTTTITTSPTADGSFSSVTLSGITLVEGDFVTATATKIDAPAMVPANELLAYGNTSEFAANVAITDVAIAAVNDVPTFGANGDGSATTAIPGSLFDIGFKSTVQNDGKLIVVGSSFFADNNISVARFNVDGTLDLTFGGGDGIAILDVGGSELAVDVAVQSDGKIVVLGTTDVVADSDLVVARFNADGTLDTGFDGDGYAITDVSGVDNAGAVAIQTDDKIVIAGANAAGGNNFTVVRYDTDGSLDTSFDTDGIVDIDFGGSSFDQASAITIQTDGMIVVGGVSDNQYALARLTVAGALDTSFDTDGLVITDFGAGNERISDLIVQSDGKIVAGGTANLDFALARYNTDGSLDTLFDTDGMQTSDMGATEQGYDLALTSSEKIVISGYTDLIGSNDVMVQRYNSDGSIDATFNTVGTVISVVGVSHEYGYSVDVLADDSVVVGGYSSPGGFLLNKYNEDGTPDTSFAPTTNLLDGNPTFVEDGSAVVLDADVEVFDQELSGGDDFGGATLTLARNGGAAAEDVFSATGNLVFNAGTLELSATNIGSYTNAGGQLDLTFAAGTTNAQVNEVMQSIAYANTSDSPPSSVQINWTFSDGNTGAQGTGGALAALGATTVDITPTNDPPTATIVASAFGIDEDDPYRPFGGFSVADIDAGTSDLAVTLTVSDGVINLTDTTGLNFTSGANDSASMTFTGTLTELNNALATFTYRPDPNFNGTDVVTLSVDDLGNTGGGSLTDNDTANIVVSPLPDDPVANDDGGVGYTTNEETSFTTGDVLANDTDADIGDTLSVQSIDTTGTLGTVLDNGDGTFDYDPNGQFEYLAAGETATDTFTYTVSDGNGGTDTATVTITINGGNDTPTANDDSGATFTTDEDTNFTTGNVLPNDTDPDATDSLAVLAIDTTGTLGLVIDIGDGTFDYDPNGQFENLAVGESATDTFVYTVSDGNGGTDTATVTITITGVNDAPTANANGGVGYTTDEETSFTTGNVLPNDTDPDTSDVLAVLSINTAGTLGNVTDNGDGTFDYDPNGQFENLAVGETDTDSFTYTISDGNGGTSTATVTITISGVNDSPTASANSGIGFATDEDTSFTTGNVLPNDLDPDTSDTLSVLSINTAGTLGLVIDNGDGTFDYDPNGQFETLAVGETATDTVVYTVSDGNGGTDTATVTITINGRNDGPTANGDAGAGYTTDEDTSFTTGNVLPNDADPDTSDTLAVVGINTAGTLGSVIDNGDGTFTYDPAGAFENLAAGETTTDTFTYTISDGNGGTDTATVTITINGVNDGPTANNDVGATDEETVLNVPASGVLSNDTDPDTSDSLTVTEVNGSAVSIGTTITLASGAQVTLNADGSYDYDPNAAFNFLSAGDTATDSFAYTIDDGNGGTDTAAVTLTINGVNDAPTANNDTAGTDEDT